MSDACTYVQYITILKKGVYEDIKETKTAASIREFTRQASITGKNRLLALTEAGWQNPVYGTLLHIIAIIRAGYLWLISFMKIVAQQKHLDRQVKGLMTMPLITILSTESTSSRGHGPDHNES